MGWLENNAESAEVTPRAEFEPTTTAATDARKLETKSQPNEIIRQMRYFLSNNTSFSWLTRRIETAVAMTTGKGLQAITRELLRGLKEVSSSTGQLSIQVSMDWDLGKFVARSYIGEVELASIICVTTDERHFEADTLGAYMARTWPNSGPLFLQTLQEWWTQHASTQGQQPFKRSILDGAVKLTALKSSMHVEIEGPLLFLIEIVEQLSWLGCICRIGQNPNELELVTPAIAQVSRESTVVDQAAFKMTFKAGDLLRRADTGHCWQKLFKDGCIACGMPISTREEEEGIGIPFAIMAKLGGFDRVAEYLGQLVLKGFETLHVPAKKTDTSIVWHLITEPNGQRISYNAIGQLEGTSDRSVCLQDLYNCKHYLGWASEVSQHAGTEDGDYDSIAEVYLDRPGPGLVLSGAGLSLSKIFGVTATFTRGKKDIGIRTSSDEVCYAELIEWMTRMDVLLYDDGEKRAWLVDAASAMLHLLRFHVAHYRPIKDSGTFIVDQFHYADSAIGSESARKVLLTPAVRQMVLIKDDQQASGSQLSGSSNSTTAGKTSWTIEDRVRDFWELFEKMFDVWKAKKAADGVKLDRLSSKLEGWKFQDVVRRLGTMDAVVADLDSSADDWLGLVREIDAVVLIGNGFGDIMKPKGNIACINWRTMPVDKYCLAIQMSRLKSITQAHGDPRTSPIKLARNVYWPIVEHPFRCECDTSGSSRNHQTPCRRNQALRSTSTGLSKNLTSSQLFNATEYENGAVIFGGRKLLKKEPEEEGHKRDAEQQRPSKITIWRKIQQRVKPKDRII